MNVGGRCLKLESCQMRRLICYLFRHCSIVLRAQILGGKKIIALIFLKISKSWYLQNFGRGYERILNMLGGGTKMNSKIPLSPVLS